MIYTNNRYIFKSVNNLSECVRIKNIIDDENPPVGEGNRFNIFENIFIELIKALHQSNKETNDMLM